MKRILKRTGVVVLSVLLIISGIMCIYFSFDYEGLGYDESKLNDNISLTINKKESYIKVKDSDTLIIMYPGAKVENEAYISLGIELAQYGYSVVIPDPLFNFMMFDINSYKKYLDGYNHYYLMGHSLGGVCAAMVDDERIEGIIFLASYSSSDLSDKGIRTISIYGDKDGVLNMDKLKDSDKYLPANNEYKIINGGNHANFGNYGEQKGDNDSTITNDEQIKITAQYIREFIYGK